MREMGVGSRELAKYDRRVRTLEEYDALANNLIRGISGSF